MNEALVETKPNGVARVEPSIAAAIMERVLLQGDLSRLEPKERVMYYRQVCESVGLNPLTKPFEYLQLNGKLTLYATRNCTDQLRKIHNVSINILSREITEGCYVVTARATMPTNRQDESIGALPIENLKGEARANAMMKGETKAKRRVTLAICGLSFMDETEVESVRGAHHVAVAEDGTITPTPQQVAEAKIAALEAGKPYESAPEFSEPQIVEQLRDSVVEAETQRGRRKKQPAKFDMLKAFGELKKRYEAIADHGAYYAVLGRYGYEHCNEFPDTEAGMAQARTAYKEMSLDIQEREAMSQEAASAAK